jgi:pyruvate dehydrogenase E2 component (dihydrolipoamide acetyltransferase)
MAQTLTLPELGEGIAGGDIVNVLVRPGDVVAENQSLLEIETDKAVVEVPATVAGRVEKVHVSAGQHIKVGGVILDIVPAGKASEAAPIPVSAPSGSPSGPVIVATPKPPPPRSTPPTPPRSALPPPQPGRPVPAAPSVRRFARELGVDIHAVSGTGPGGRIGMEDIKVYVREGQAGARAIGVGGGPLPAALPDFSQWGPVERKPLSSLRKKIADQMQLAWTIPMVTHFDEADVTELEAFRKAQSAGVKETGGSLTITCFLFKAVAEALHEFPHFNTSLDLARGELVYKRYVHLGIAVDTEAGLVVPVIRDVDRKSLRDLAKELTVISQKARNRKLGVEEMRGATFSISNLGGIGGTQFTPLVNPPQVAILGVSKSALKPVWREGQFVPRLMCPLALSYDHRVIDGADAARFMARIVRAIENFASPLLDTKPSV